MSPFPWSRSGPAALPESGLDLRGDRSLFGGHATPATDHLSTPRGPITIRPVRPLDARPIDAFVDGLSDRTRHERFLDVGVDHLRPDQLAGIVDVDHLRRETVVAVAGHEIVGLGQFLEVAGDGGTVEVAVVVADGWHGFGVGGRLLRTTYAAAAATGHGQAIGVVGAQNAPMIELLQRACPRTVLAGTGPVVDVLVDLR